MVDFVIGAPAWDRAWSLPLWFDSVRANVDPQSTGLVFVVPASDSLTREAIADGARGFAFVEVLRDRNEPTPRDQRPATKHRTLAMARNQLLQTVHRIRPKHYISWDTDFLVAPGAVSRMCAHGQHVITPWAWLNRQRPQKVTFDGTEVLYEQPFCGTGMSWDPRNPGRPLHYPAESFLDRARGVWRCSIALAFKLMDQRAYGRANYGPHHDGEDVTFNWQLECNGIERWIDGNEIGVHLYDRDAREEQLGYEGAMKLARQAPLAASWDGHRSDEYEAFGFFPSEVTT